MKLPKFATQKRAQIVSVPAPIGGWNVKDPLPEMKALDAVILDNIFCLPSELQVRKGYTQWATGMTGNAVGMFDYSSTSGAALLYSLTDAGNIYDVSAGGVVGAAVVTGLTSTNFKHAHFTNTGGTFLYFVNGADSPYIFNGTAWQQVTGVSAPFAITGVTTSTLVDVIAHKRRLWFVQKNSTKCWYLPIDSVGGLAAMFDFGAVFSMGGHVTKIDTWTLDAGYGVDDYFVVFSSTGEVAIYRGTDPASATTWALTGVFYIGSPTGTGYTCKYGGDLLIINKDGIAQMSKSLMSSRVNTRLTLTEKIQPQLANDTTTYASLNGWNILLHAPLNMLIVNVPLSSTVSYQYVMNTISGAWSRWTGINGQCWYSANELLYFGLGTKIYRAWDTQSDNGSIVTATILPAYSKFGNESTLKRWNMTRVTFAANTTASVATQVLADFNQSPEVLTNPAVTASASSLWGTALWGTNTWGGSLVIDSKWRSVSGMGYWGSCQINIQTLSADVRVYSIDYSIEAGGVL